MPARPEVAALEPIRIVPLLPLLALPELKTSIPLVPEEPEFADFIDMTPLLLAVPSPEKTLTYPPELTVLRPGLI